MALSSLAEGGTCVHFGASAGRSVTFNSGTFFLTGRTSLYGFYLWTEIGAQPAGEGLAILVNLVAQGRLRPRIEVEAPWTQVGEVAQQLLDRRYAGKAVLTVD
jgi:NADPH:quinone reductase-like Zn-dependent oxidoreductase